MKKLVSVFKGVREGVEHVFAFGYENDVIRKDFCDDVDLPHLLQPRSHVETDEHDRERAALWYAASSRVGSSDASVYAVVGFETFSKFGVCPQDLLWHPRHLRGFVEDGSLDLVKDLLYVGRAPTVGGALQVGELEVEEEVVPGVCCSWQPIPGSRVLRW